jgi:hypothetical protein
MLYIVEQRSLNRKDKLQPISAQQAPELPQLRVGTILPNNAATFSAPDLFQKFLIVPLVPIGELFSEAKDNTRKEKFHSKNF